MYDKTGSSGEHISFSDTAILTIHRPIEVLISSSTTTCNVGQQIQFTATTSGGTNSFRYQWYANGNPISGATSASYSFTPTETGTTNIYATAEDSQDSYLAEATSNSITVTATAQSTTPPPNQQGSGNSDGNTGSTAGGSGNQEIPITYTVIVLVVVIAVVGTIAGLAVRQRKGKTKPAN